MVENTEPDSIYKYVEAIEIHCAVHLHESCSQRAAGHTRDKRKRANKTRNAHYSSPACRHARRHPARGIIECCMLSIVSRGNKQTDLLRLRDKPKIQRPSVSMFIVKSRHVRRRRHVARQN